jgi:phosphatidyl-myo-inositol dimannoside synthase
VVKRIPGAALLIVGAGPYGAALHDLSERTGVTASVRFTGPVPQAELPAHYAAGDVFSMPCRTRRGGLDVEGLGIVYLEASAAGLPVVGGDSGGAPDAILEGETGYVVGGRDVSGLAERLVTLLNDPAGAKAMGDKGRAWVERDWNWDLSASRLRALIDALAAGPPQRRAGVAYCSANSRYRACRAPRTTATASAISCCDVAVDATWKAAARNCSTSVRSCE